MIVAVVDSGVDANPQFEDRVIVGPDLVAGTKRGIPPGADCVGHGTAVASIIAAAPMRGISFTGVAPAARILSVKISGTDTFPTSATPQGIMDAVQFGADVINLSLATTDDVPALRHAVAYALSHNVVVVAAAGNDVPQDGTGPFYPAAYPGVLSVGAAGPGGALAPFSDRRTQVGVTAPGVNVTSAYPGTFPDAYNPDQSGTSFAAAYVSGVAALVRATHPRLNPAQVVARIEATARGSTGPGTGHGLIDPVRAVTAVLPGDPAAAPAASTSPSSASPRQHQSSQHQRCHPAGPREPDRGFGSGRERGEQGGDRGLVRPYRGGRGYGGAGHRPPSPRRARALGRIRLAARGQDGTRLSATRTALCWSALAGWSALRGHRVGVAGHLGHRADIQRRRERLGGHEPGVHPDRGGHRAVGAHGQPDPVRDVQAGVPAGLLHDPDHVARGPFGRQFRRHLQVQRDQAGVAGQGRGRRRIGGRQLQVVLARLQLDPGGEDALAGLGPLARLDRPDHLLHLAADPGPEHPRVHRQLEPAQAGRVGRQLDRLDVDLVGDQAGERGQRLGVRVGDGERGQRQPDPQLVRLAQAERGAADDCGPGPWPR